MCREAKARLFHQSHAENLPQGFWVLIEFRESTFLFDKDKDIYQPLWILSTLFLVEICGGQFHHDFQQVIWFYVIHPFRLRRTDTYLPPCKNCTSSNLGLVRIWSQLRIIMCLNIKALWHREELTVSARIVRPRPRGQLETPWTKFLNLFRSG